MKIYHKNKTVQTEEQAEQLLSALDEFIATGTSLMFGNAQPILDQELKIIYRDYRNDWEWSEESKQEIDQREKQDQEESDKIAVYKNDLVLWKNERVKPLRNTDLNNVLWIRDRHRDQVEIGGNKDLTPEQFSDFLVYIQELRDWPATFTKYVTDKTIESRRPEKPSYIIE